MKISIPVPLFGGGGEVQESLYPEAQGRTKSGVARCQRDSLTGNLRDLGVCAEKEAPQEIGSIGSAYGKAKEDR